MKYSEEMVKRCAEWVREYGLIECGGASLISYCAAMAIDTETHRRWLNKAEYADAIKRAKEEFRGKLEKNIVTSMAQAATGYEFEETSTEFINRDGVPVPRKTLKTKKRVQPNVAAGIFLLTNIAPERWKNKQNTEHTGQIDTGITFVVENEEQVDKLKRLAERKPRNESND
jgi:hypothetical protein